ncbi:MAG: HAMP domain-containing histidine kinase [Lachnospiraceae bacterium]|nr:HAMP domain-containing histidine kinase [Lachnospiraceae bacterium]
MKKTTFQRFIFEFLSHIVLGLLALIIGLIMSLSNIEINSLSGTKEYNFDFFRTGGLFEDSQLFTELFKESIEDIARLVVIKEQFEDDGAFNPSKLIDVTGFVERKGEYSGTFATVVYELDDLIKWGRFGIEYEDLSMGSYGFAEFFGNIIFPENFAFDQYGNLYFDGFYTVDTSNTVDYYFDNRTVLSAEVHDQLVSEIQEKYGLGSEIGATLHVQAELDSMTYSEIMDLVVAYLVTALQDEIDLETSDAGELMVSFSMINERYATYDGQSAIFSSVDNWIDYFALQNNLKEAIESIAVNYEQYVKSMEYYGEDEGNLKYAIRMSNEMGVTHTFTNISDLENYSDEQLTEYFGEYRRFFIYYPDSLDFTGNSSFTEETIFNILRNYDYAYPTNTMIWVGVDTNYPIHDAFYDANLAFSRVSQNSRRLLVIMLILLGMWLIDVVYLTMIMGSSSFDESEGDIILYPIDKIKTEILLLIGVMFAGLAIMQYPYFYDSALNANYGIWFIYGFMVSLFISLIWYSLVRRFRFKTLYENSLIRVLSDVSKKVVDFSSKHVDSAFSSILNYFLFLVINGMFLYGIYRFRDRSLGIILIIILVIIDLVVAGIRFKSTAERNDIMDGIRRIRDGEVDYKIDNESLHGYNRELADAVNNIGEGIRKAVRTSMKDEQMKTDLITNVSHDLKTPLTSIINYVDLLKRLKIQDETANSYISILDSKSQRLKTLTEDLVEVSRISSGNINLEMGKINLFELVNQAAGEFADKFEDSGLSLFVNKKGVNMDVYVDSKRMWRVIENQLNNICKYALENSRVYVDVEEKDGNVVLSLKNISKAQMNITPDELTERFIRGDSSRSTEGSGLGLSISKSLVEAMGGSFEIVLDGDLFKAVITFPIYKEMV